MRLPSIIPRVWSYDLKGVYTAWGVIEMLCNRLCEVSRLPYASQPWEAEVGTDSRTKSSISSSATTSYIQKAVAL